MWWIPAAWAWEVLGPAGAPTGRVVEPTSLFTAENPTWEAPQLVTDSALLARAASEALAWLDAHPDAPATGLFPDLGHNRDATRRTLELLTAHAAELGDPAFLAANVTLLRWHPDTEAAGARKIALDPTQIRLTRYFIPRVAGSPVKTKRYSSALYADPGDTLRTRYSRAEVFSGVYEKEARGAATALCWLRPEDAYDALLQGSIEVTWTEGETRISRLLNVDVQNGRPYVPGRAAAEQEQLWYFREVDGPYGYGTNPDKLHLEPTISVAADPWNLGLGRVFLLAYPDGAGGTSLRIVIVGDTGGAFQPNLFQLDWLAGAYADRAELYAATAELPERVQAWAIVAR